MLKSELIKKVTVQAKISEITSEIIVKLIFNSIKEALAKGEKIEIRGFGSFTVRKYKTYTGRNPRTGGLVEVNAKKLPYFRAGRKLKERLNR